MGKANVNLFIALLSIIFYLSLSLVSIIYHLKFEYLNNITTTKSPPLNSSEFENNSNSTINTSMGKFDKIKSKFFLVLFLSSLLELPFYIGCIAYGGPDFCYYESIWNGIGWFLHLIAICGFAFTIIVPSVIWLDLLNKKDGKLFFSHFPVDNTKRYFQILLISYLLISLIDIIGGIFYFRVSDPSYYASNVLIDSICTFLEPFLIFFISFGCLFTGIRLQRYVLKSGLNFQILIKFIFSLNLTMLLITSSYFARAIMIYQLVIFIPSEAQITIKYTYFVWIFMTRWLPNIFCSFCLVNMMRFSGAEIGFKMNDKDFLDNSHKNVSPFFIDKKEFQDEKNIGGISTDINLNDDRESYFTFDTDSVRSLSTSSNQTNQGTGKTLSIMLNTYIRPFNEDIDDIPVSISPDEFSHINYEQDFMRNFSSEA